MPSPQEDDNLPDDDWTLYKPYQGITTTPMDPYQEDDCYFGDNTFPNMMQQCSCFGAIKVVPNDTMALYQQVRQDMNEEFYNGQYNEPFDSCTPSNQAMIWLASGDTRDAGDLYQRYILADSFVQLNGTNWDANNLWMSDDSECLWLGMGCNSRYQVNNMALDANNVHGSLPTELAKVQDLETLSITRNHLTGKIPPEITLMPHLENLILYDNQLRGSVPTEIGDSSTLKSIKLDNNLFFGVLASELGKVTTLEEISVGFNEFRLRLPTELGLLTNLKSFELQDNSFSGRIPTEYGMLSNIELFLLQSNLLVGPIPTQFASMTKLHEFRVANTGVGGVFPSLLGDAWKNIYRLELGGNNFHGTIMTEFGLMTDLGLLALNNNKFTGTIPTEFGNLQNMTRLSFKNTLIEGTIPTELGLMTKLANLSVEKNRIVGSAPESVCALRDLSLVLFVTDCPARGDVGVICPIPSCCSFCRRGESNSHGG